MYEDQIKEVDQILGEIYSERIGPNEDFNFTKLKDELSRISRWASQPSAVKALLDHIKTEEHEALVLIEILKSFLYIRDHINPNLQDFAKRIEREFEQRKIIVPYEVRVLPYH